MAALDQSPNQVYRVYSNIDTTREEQVQDIGISNVNLTEMVASHYIRLGDSFNFDYADILIFDNRFEIEIGNNEGSPTVNLNNLLHEYFVYNDNFYNIAQMLEVRPDVDLASHYIVHYFDDNFNLLPEGIVDLNFTNAGGYFKVGASNIYISNLRVELTFPYLTSDFDVNVFEVSYQGYIDIGNGRDVDTPDTLGINHHLPVQFRINNTHIDDDFDLNHSELIWETTCEHGCISLRTYITLLDENNSADFTISAGIGENETSEFDEIVNIVPPKGLGSLDDLAISTAHFSSIRTEFQNFTAHLVIPDFDFLPLDVASYANTGIVHYTNVTYNRVFIGGLSNIEDQEYTSQFIKSYCSSNTYTITLTGRQGSTLTYNTIRDRFFPTLSMGGENVLTDDEFGLEILQRFGVSEEDTTLLNPVINIGFTPYIYYNVTSEVVPVDTTYAPLIAYSTFINLDGSVLSFIDFRFHEYGPCQGFQNAFDTTNGDAAFQSLDINSFGLISVNRDFNTDKISELRNQDIFAFRDADVMLKNCLSAVINTAFVSNCNSNTFCSLMKSNSIQAHWNLTGQVAPNTNLVTPVHNFTLNEFVEVNSTNFALNITVGGHVETTVTSNFISHIEPERPFMIRTHWTFTDNPSDFIMLNGVKNDLYQHVFGIEWLDLAQVQVSGMIHTDGTISDFYLSSAGILGHDCYSRQEMVSELQTLNDVARIHVSSFYGEGDNGEISVLNERCIVGSGYVTPITSDLERSYLIGDFNFDNLEHVLSTIYTTGLRDRMPHLMNSIEFPAGLGFMTSYRSAQREFYMRGDMDFLGVNSAGRIRFDMEQETGDLEIYLPDWSIGGGNMRFHRDEDENPITMSSQLNPQSMQTSRLHFTSGVTLLGISSQVDQVLTEQAMIFSIHGNPFNGVFTSENTVQVTPVRDIEAENNSILDLIFDQDRAYFELEQELNGLFQHWMARILRITLRADDLVSEYTAQINFLRDRYIPETHCRPEDYCLETPTLVCSQYAQQAVCAQEQDVCLAMTQTCTQERFECARRDVNGECVDSIAVCDRWENQCQDGATERLCVRFENEDIPNECLRMELRCPTVARPQFSCSVYNQQITEAVDRLQQRIEQVAELRQFVSPLENTCYCSLDIHDHADSSYHESCMYKAASIHGIPDEFDFLDTARLRDVRANVPLRNAAAADLLVFESKVSLFGDWKSQSGRSDRLVVRNYIPVEQENTDHGYDLGVESVMTINHRVDFSSVEQTAPRMFEAVSQLVCAEHGIAEAESVRMQVLLRELGLLDGNGTLCHQVHDIEIPDIHSQERNSYDQASIYEPNLHSDTEYTISYSQNPRGEIGVLTEVFGPDVNTIPLSEISQVYQEQRTIQDGFDQDLINELFDESPLTNTDNLSDDEIDELIASQDQINIDAENQAQALAEAEQQAQEYLDIQNQEFIDAQAARNSDSVDDASDRIDERAEQIITQRENEEMREAVLETNQGSIDSLRTTVESVASDLQEEYDEELIETISENNLAEVDSARESNEQRLDTVNQDQANLESSMEYIEDVEQEEAESEPETEEEAAPVEEETSPVEEESEPTEAEQEQTAAQTQAVVASSQSSLTQSENGLSNYQLRTNRPSVSSQEQEVVEEVPAVEEEQSVEQTEEQPAEETNSESITQTSNGQQTQELSASQSNSDDQAAIDESAEENQGENAQLENDEQLGETEQEVPETQPTEPVSEEPVEVAPEETAEEQQEEVEQENETEGSQLENSQAVNEEEQSLPEATPSPEATQDEVVEENSEDNSQLENDVALNQEAQSVPDQSEAVEPVEQEEVVEAEPVATSQPTYEELSGETSQLTNSQDSYELEHQVDQSFMTDDREQAQDVNDVVEGSTDEEAAPAATQDEPVTVDNQETQAITSSSHDSINDLRNELSSNQIDEANEQGSTEIADQIAAEQEIEQEVADNESSINDLRDIYSSSQDDESAVVMQQDELVTANESILEQERQRIFGDGLLTQQTQR